MYTINLCNYCHVLAGAEATADDISAFMDEVMRMKGFTHRNVLTIIGLVFNENQPYVVLPYMENGDLKSFLSDPDRVSQLHTCIHYYHIIPVPVYSYTYINTASCSLVVCIRAIMVYIVL